MKQLHNYHIYSVLCNEPNMHVYIQHSVRKRRYEVMKMSHDFMAYYIQWCLRIKDTLGAELLSFIWRLSSGGRFESLYIEVVFWWEGPVQEAPLYNIICIIGSGND